MTSALTFQRLLSPLKQKIKVMGFTGYLKLKRGLFKYLIVYRSKISGTYLPQYTQDIGIDLPNLKLVNLSLFTNGVLMSNTQGVT